ncbi:MAG: ribonuclease P protein component [Bacteroidetes bacterium 46-16]|nr:MAG: ribonuclease P protein component [Bacteroidetes bacterium 46-16]
MRNTFKAYERLKREQHIDTLFRTGKAFSVFPIRFVYTTVARSNELSPVRVGFSIPKKRFRSSVHRHRIRRLIAEAWRLQKHDLYAAIPAEKQLQVFLIFADSTMPEFETIQKAVKEGIDKLVKLHA